MAANLRPTLPGCALPMVRNPVRSGIMYDETAYCAIAQGRVDTMKHWGRWLILALLWCVAWSFPVLHCPFLLGAVGRGPLFLEGDVVRLTKETSGLSRMETLSKRFRQYRNVRRPRSVGPTLPASPAGGLQNVRSKGPRSRRGSQGRVVATGSEGVHRVHSGNPAFRRPSISNFAFDCPPRAIQADIVKLGSS